MKNSNLENTKQIYVHPTAIVQNSMENFGGVLWCGSMWLYRRMFG